MQPYVVFEKDLDSRIAEAFVTGGEGWTGSGDIKHSGTDGTHTRGQDLKARLFLPNGDGTGMVGSFTIASSSADGTAREPFLPHGWRTTNNC